MSIVVRSQPYRLEWPTPTDNLDTLDTKESVVVYNTDEMFQILFDDLKKVADAVNSLSGISVAQAAARISLRV